VILHSSNLSFPDYKLCVLARMSDHRNQAQTMWLNQLKDPSLSFLVDLKYKA